MSLPIDRDHGFARIQRIAEQHSIRPFGLSKHGGSMLGHPDVVEELEICRHHLGALFVDGMTSAELHARIQTVAGRMMAHGSALVAAIDAGLSTEAVKPGSRVAHITGSPRSLVRSECLAA